MFGTKGDSPKRTGAWMPPATTRRLPERNAASTREGHIAPPFVPHGAPLPAPAPIVADEQPQSFSEPLAATTNEAIADAPPWEPDVAPAAEEQPPMDVSGFEPAADASPDVEAWEAIFDVEAFTEQFPLDAFIVPEQAQHVPTGLEGTTATPPPETTAATSLAERLEKLSHRLRVEDSDSVVRRLAGGDRLDALLAGLLAGYLAGKSEQQ